MHVLYHHPDYEPISVTCGLFAAGKQVFCARFPQMCNRITTLSCVGVIRIRLNDKNVYVIVHMQSFETHAIINSSGISGSFEIKFLEIYLKVDMIKVILQLLNNCLLLVNIKTTTDQHFLERGYLHIEVKFISKKISLLSYH